MDALDAMSQAIHYRNQLPDGDPGRRQSRQDQTMTPDHIDALSADAGARMAALEDDTVPLDEHIARMEEMEDDGFITPPYYLSNECSD